MTELCPVCKGVGTVPQGFYEGALYPDGTNTARETCRTCGGTGVIGQQQ